MILLAGLGALALAAAAAAVTALALTGHQQRAQDAFEAAESGIAYALAQAGVLRSAGSIPETPHPAGVEGHASYRTETRTAQGPGALPAGFSIGENSGTFGARLYFVVAVGWAGRAGRARLEQGFYLVEPAT
jgi:hypothetical protein